MNTTNKLFLIEKRRVYEAYKAVKSAKGAAQGCSTLFEVFHVVKGFDPSKSGGVSILGDSVGLIEAKDVVGEAAQSGEDRAA
jgi:hypothetical protein